MSHAQIKSWERQTTKGIELPNQENINAKRAGKLPLLENIGSEYHQEVDRKEKFEKNTEE